MNFDCLSENEVRMQYNQAENKNHVLRILADFTESTPAEVANFLGVEYQKPQRFKINEEKAFELYSAGMVDREIGEILKVSLKTITAWRARNSLPSNRKISDMKLRMQLYEEGYNDSEIADATGVTSATIGTWRRNLGLIKNRSKSSRNAC